MEVSNHPLSLEESRRGLIIANTTRANIIVGLVRDAEYRPEEGGALFLKELTDWLNTPVDHPSFNQDNPIPMHIFADITPFSKGAAFCEDGNGLCVHLDDPFSGLLKIPTSIAAVRKAIDEVFGLERKFIKENKNGLIDLASDDNNPYHLAFKLGFARSLAILHRIGRNDYHRLFAEFAKNLVANGWPKDWLSSPEPWEAEREALDYGAEVDSMLESLNLSPPDNEGDSTTLTKPTTTDREEIEKLQRAAAAFFKDFTTPDDFAKAVFSGIDEINLDFPRRRKTTLFS